MGLWAPNPVPNVHVNSLDSIHWFTYKFPGMTIFLPPLLSKSFVHLKTKLSIPEVTQIASGTLSTRACWNHIRLLAISVLATFKSSGHFSYSPLRIGHSVSLHLWSDLLSPSRRHSTNNYAVSSPIRLSSL